MYTSAWYLIVLHEISEEETGRPNQDGNKTYKTLGIGSKVQGSRWNGVRLSPQTPLDNTWDAIVLTEHWLNTAGSLDHQKGRYESAHDWVRMKRSEEEEEEESKEDQICTPGLQLKQGRGFLNSREIGWDRREAFEESEESEAADLW